MSIESDKARDKWKSDNPFGDQKHLSWDNVPSRQHAAEISCVAYSPNIEQACMQNTRKETVKKLEVHAAILESWGIENQNLKYSISSLKSIEDIQYNNDHFRGSLKDNFEKVIRDEFKNEKLYESIVKTAPETSKKQYLDSLKNAEVTINDNLSKISEKDSKNFLEKNAELVKNINSAADRDALHTAIKEAITYTDSLEKKLNEAIADREVEILFEKVQDNFSDFGKSPEPNQQEEVIEAIVGKISDFNEAEL